MACSTNRSTPDGLASHLSLLCVTSPRKPHPLCDQANRHGSTVFGPLPHLLLRPVTYMDAELRGGSRNSDCFLMPLGGYEPEARRWTSRCAAGPIPPTGPGKGRCLRDPRVAEEP